LKSGFLSKYVLVSHGRKKTDERKLGQAREDRNLSRRERVSFFTPLMAQHFFERGKKK